MKKRLRSGKKNAFPLVRYEFIVEGRVQGVGFRPYIWREARARSLTGFVRNTSEGVRIEVQGAQDKITDLEKVFYSSLPPLARIVGVKKKLLPTKAAENSFEIHASCTEAGHKILVSPDISICDACLADIREAGNRRENYAFTNCTDCGPRFSITAALPYDRKNTSMACFKLCASCSAQYADPGDRRFHAQPLACPECGPRLWFVRKDDASSAPSGYNIENALEKAAALVFDGGILALKGLGGYQLVCDARNSTAVSILRARKKRPHKALAVMAGSISTIEKFCNLPAEASAILNSQQKPIVVCQLHGNCDIAPEVAPDCDSAGMMLPYTPLHWLLFEKLEDMGMKEPLLVMTSANPAGEPICLGNREGYQRLAHIADGWLMHDRDILVRIDDSVINIIQSENGLRPLPIRRARGYVPEPVETTENISGVLGMGAEKKNTFCLTRGPFAFPGQHIGDLNTPGHLEFYKSALSHMQNLLDTEPRFLVRDLHPDFISSRLAEEMGKALNLPVFSLQHHAAHAAAVLGEHKFIQPALALCLDGSGLGADGTIWGGELLRMELDKPEWSRIGGLTTFSLPGGEAAIKAPWRIVCGMDPEADGKGLWTQKEARIITSMISRNINSPLTSSLGRLFDTVAVILLGIREITYEGQAAIKLETLARKHTGNFSKRIFSTKCHTDGEYAKIDSRSFFRQAKQALKRGHPLAEIALSFHHAISCALANLALQGASKYGLDTVALCGGVLNNRFVAEWLPEQLISRGLTPLMPINLPPGDGAISFGQAIWGQKLVSRMEDRI